jgi:hypothetical protein
MAPIRVHPLRPAAFFAAVAAAALLISLGAPAERADAAKRCGTYASTSSYDRARVVAIRGVKCKRAVRIARRYDRRFVTPGPWRCGLAHGGGRRLFSCGAGGTSGDLRDWPHALKSLGVGSPG